MRVDNKDTKKYRAVIYTRIRKIEDWSEHTKNIIEEVMNRRCKYQEIDIYAFSAKKN